MIQPLGRSRRLTLGLVAAVAILTSACASSGSAELSAEPEGAPSVESVQAGEAPPGQGAALPTTAAIADPAPPENPVATDDASIETPAPLPDPLACLSRRARIAQLLLPLASQPELAGARSLAAAGDLGGIGLLGSPDQGLVDELATLQQASFVPVLVASDEEGGSVQRLASLLGAMPSAASAATNQTPEQVQQAWADYGRQVSALGIDVIFGPVVDVGGGPGIGSRSFSSDPATVAIYGAAVADGLLEAGVTPVFKHFPGHGSATADSHLELPAAPSLDELRAKDLLPYADLLARDNYQGRIGVMIGHLAVPGLSGSVPTSLSPEAVNGLLRTEFGYSGLVFTDAMNMRAIIDGYGVPEALELAFVAGADIGILGSLADVGPALDYLVARAEADPSLASLLDNRTLRVLSVKSSQDICAGAQ